MIDVALPGAVATFTTRQGGVSQGPYSSLNLGILTDDDPEHVRRNREIVAEKLGIGPGAMVMGWQVHGAEVAEWAAPPPPGSDGYARPGAELKKVDGHTTTHDDLALLVLVADCLPVALAVRGRVAMLHCGWRGMAAGIIERALRDFEEAPAAAIGPGIGRCCYEVGDEVLGAFADVDNVAEGRMLDLRGVAEKKLKAAGVEQVEQVPLCTSCRPDLFFSHRREDGVTGRQAGIVRRVG